MKNVWIDTDLGLDDALAIIWAIQEEKNLNWKIHGISTTKGNLDLPQVNGNTVALLKHLGREDIPIYNGISDTLVETAYADASHVHGTALGPIDVKPIPSNPDKKSPLALANFLSKLEGKLTLITLGPLTNIAIFIRLYPELLWKIENIVIMGGGSYGNVSHYAEFNIHVDPEAAHIVFESGITILMSGLDISDEHTYIQRREFDHYLNLSYNPWTSKILHYMANKLNKSDPQDILSLYDPTAMVAAAFPELFETYESSVFVVCQEKVRGMTIMSKRSQLKIIPSDNLSTRVLRFCQREKFLEILFKGL